jgi:hypothetical protein
MQDRTIIQKTATYLLFCIDVNLTSMTLVEEHKLRMFEKMMLRIIFVSKTGRKMRLEKIV